MDLRRYNISDKEISQLKGESFYQPFILSDDFQTGVGYSWLTGEMILAMDRRNDICYEYIGPKKPFNILKCHITDERWNQFTHANQLVRNMYDSWIHSICDFTSLNSETRVVDTAANAGYFLYRFSEMEVGKCIGYDILNLHKNYEIFNKVMGLDVEFKNHSYDMNSHSIPGAQKADIVISSAIMCHLSDPTYYLSFLGSITKKVLFLFSAISDNELFTITYGGAKCYFPDNKFPICFDEMTSISKGLIEFGLKEMGFRKIVELPYKNNWVPYEWYKNYKAIIAIK